MYKLIIPALLTASLVGCGGDDGASQVDQSKDQQNPVVEQTAPEMVAQQEPSLRKYEEPTAVYGNQVPHKVDSEGRIAPPDYKITAAGTPSLDPSKFVAPPTYTGETPQLRDENGLIAPPPVKGDTPQLRDENGLIAPPLVKGDTPQLKDENGLIAPPPVKGDAPQLKDENGLVAPPEVNANNPGEDLYIAKLVPVSGNVFEALTLDNLTVQYSLDEARLNPELSISMQQVSSDYMDRYEVKVDGIEIDLSNWVTPLGDGFELDLFPEDLEKINLENGTQLSKLSDLIGATDGVMRLVFGSHTINLQAEEPAS